MTQIPNLPEGYLSYLSLLLYFSAIKAKFERKQLTIFRETTLQSAKKGRWVTHTVHILKTKSGHLKLPLYRLKKYPKGVAKAIYPHIAKKRS